MENQNSIKKALDEKRDGKKKMKAAGEMIKRYENHESIIRIGG